MRAAEAQTHCFEFWSLLAPEGVDWLVKWIGGLTVQIRAISRIDDKVHALAHEASDDGFRMLDVLIAEFKSGSNRFDKHGECLLGAFDADQLIAIGGLNKEVYVPGSAAGRVRRFFVHRQWRRTGVGASLLREIESRADGCFPVLQLFTPSPAAGAFYEALGYTRCNRHKVSHEKRLLSSA